MRTQGLHRTSLGVQGLGTLALAILLILPAGALAITFGEWATAQGWPVGYEVPATVSANSSLIDNLIGMGSYDWIGTPTTFLYLNNNQIASIESGDFSGLSGLKDLSLHDNRLAGVEPGDFSGLGSLAYLDLSRNQITSIESGDCSGPIALQYLYLHSNRITSIEADDFSGLGSLTILHLSDNQIASIESGDFSGLGNLERLYLSRNQITSIESGDFSGPSALEWLLLDNNRIASIESGDFSGLGNLERLFLSNNQITSIESGAFSGLGSLKNLYLENNSTLTALNLEGASLSRLLYLVLENDTNIFRVSLKDATLKQHAMAAICDGGATGTYYIGIGELPGVTELDMSGVDFSAITDYSPLYTLNHLTRLWLVGVKNMDALKLDVLLDNLDAMQDPAIEGVLYMTRADYDAFNAAGGGLLAIWDAEPGHHVQASNIPGDANGDGVVADADATALAAHWGMSGMTWFDGDFNWDRTVDAADASILAANWDHSVSESGTVPEPSALVMLLAVAAASLARLHRRE